MLKKSSFFLLFLGLFLHSSISISAPKAKDWAVFKLSDEIYFTSDLVPFYQDFSTFRCAYEDAVLLKMMHLDFSKSEGELIEKTGLEDGTPFSAERKKIWVELKKVIKLSLYVSQSKVVMKENLPKEVLNLAKASNCKTRGKMAEKNIEKFLKMEIFLKSRFNNRFYLDPKESNKVDKKGNDKMEEAMEAFFKTIDRQVLAEDFF